MHTTFNLLKTVAAVLAVGAISAPGAVASRAPVSKHATTPAVHRMHLGLQVVSNVLVHNGAATPITASSTFATGDTAYFVADILKDKRKVGREDVWCGMTTPTFQLCTAVDHLPGGVITHVGANSLTASVLTDVITGGTGRYAGAQGSVLTRFPSATAGTIDYVLAP